MSIFDYAEDKQFQEELKNLFEGKLRVSKNELVDFLKKKPKEEITPIEEEKEEVEIIEPEAVSTEEKEEKEEVIEAPQIMDRLLDEYKDPEKPKTIDVSQAHYLAYGGGGENNSIITVGNGTSIYKDKVGPDLRLKTLIGGSNVTITDNGDTLTLSSSVSGSDSWSSVSADYYTSTQTDNLLNNKADLSAVSADADTWPSVSADYYTKTNIDNRNLEDLNNVYDISANDYSMLNYVSSANTWRASDSQWDDLRFQFTSQQRGVIVTDFKPDFDETNLGLLFPQDDATEIVYIIGQFSHNRKNGSNIRPHIHFIQSTSAQPTFFMEYRWYKNGSQVPSFTTLSATDFSFTYTSGSILQIASFPEIDGSAIDTVSSVMDIKIYRDDDVVAGDVLAKEFDIHYQVDSFGGSRSEFTK